MVLLLLYYSHIRGDNTKKNIKKHSFIDIHPKKTLIYISIYTRILYQNRIKLILIIHSFIQEKEKNEHT